jgi:hypothetical protein
MGLQLDIIPRWVVLDSGYAAGSYVAHDWEVADVGTPRADAAIAARRAA